MHHLDGRATWLLVVTSERGYAPSPMATKLLTSRISVCSRAFSLYLLLSSCR